MHLNDKSSSGRPAIIGSFTRLQCYRRFRIGPGRVDMASRGLKCHLVRRVAAPQGGGRNARRKEVLFFAAFAQSRLDRFEQVGCIEGFI